MKCHHCGGNILVDQCLQCARHVKNGTPYNVISISEKIIKKRGPHPSGKISGALGKCRCCGHEKRLWSDGLCSSCISFVNGHYGKYWPIGSKEREDVLKRVAAWKTTKGRRTLKEYGKESIVIAG